MLRLSELRASYGAAPVLHGVDLFVAKGETVALLGPNGAGKSTLLAALTATLRNRSGSVTFDGVELVRKPSHEIVQRGVALVPEGRLVFAPFSVEDNLRLGAIRLRGDVKERYRFVYRLFPRLEERRAQFAGTLSGGEQQMLAIGRGLMSEPRLLILDEPSLGLSPMLVDEMFQLIGELNRDGLAILLIEQNAVQSLEAAQRAYIVEHGRVAMSGAARELARNPELRKRYLGL